MSGATHTPSGDRSGTERGSTASRRHSDAGEEQSGPVTRSEQDPLQATLQSTGRFVWDHLPSVVLVSVAWFLASLPVVTIGPATVGAYRAVLSLRAGEGLDVDAIRATVRRQFVHATLLGMLPLIVLGAAINYGIAYVRTGELLAGALAVGGVYLAVYASLVLVPTFVGLAGGKDVATALWHGYRWTANHVVGTIVLGTMTVGILALVSLLTVAAVLLFAGVACAFHVEFVTAIDDDFTPRSSQ